MCFRKSWAGWRMDEYTISNVKTYQVGVISLQVVGYGSHKRLFTIWLCKVGGNGGGRLNNILSHA
jgi:hypothetical protein